LQQDDVALVVFLHSGKEQGEKSMIERSEAILKGIVYRNKRIKG